MSATVLQRAAVAELPTTSTTAPSPSLVKYPPRPAAACWPATELSRERALTTLSSAPFVLDQRKAQSRRVTGLRLLLDWLTTQPGTSWQERWLASGADAAGPAWREVPQVGCTSKVTTPSGARRRWSRRCRSQSAPT
jgi:hypothetical protein